jgi:hypothetical protein
MVRQVLWRVMCLAVWLGTVNVNCASICVAGGVAGGVDGRMAGGVLIVCLVVRWWCGC